MKGRVIYECMIFFGLFLQCYFTVCYLNVTLCTVHKSFPFMYEEQYLFLLK